MSKRTIARSESTADPVVVASQHHDLALAASAKGKYREARRHCFRSLRILESTMGPGSLDFANVLHSLATIQEKESQNLTAQKTCLRALQIVRKAEQTPEADRLHIQILLSLGRLCRAQRRYKEAEPHYRRALGLAEDRDDQPQQLARVLNAMASLYRDTTRFDEAARAYERSLDVTRRAQGANHPQVATICHQLGSLAQARKQHTLAESWVRRALKIHTAALGPAHPETVADAARLAAVLTARKKYQQAEAFYRRALTTFEKAYGSNHLEVALVLNNLAALYQAQGDAVKALPLYERVLAIKEELLGSDHPEIVTVLNNLAVLNRALRNFEEGRVLYGRDLKIAMKSMGGSHPHVARTLMNYAHLLRAEAESMEKRARQIDADLRLTSGAGDKRPGVSRKAASFRLAVRPSRIHRWGVYAEETIPARRQIIEYTGKRILRGNRAIGHKLHYLFLLRKRKYWAIDGALGGGAQYINHSCAPNVRAKQIGDRVFYFSKRPIAPGEELLVDYKFHKVTNTADAVPCSCGASNCRGTINRK